MKLKDFVELYENIENGEPTLNESYFRKVGEVIKKLKCFAGNAENIILERIDEKDLVIALSLIESVVVSMLMAEGKTDLLRAKMTGELQEYTHSVVLATIGLLIEEEIL